MTELIFRNLTAEDVEVRVQSTTKKTINILIYKNARVDMAILNDTVGAFGWTREHTFKDGINYCKVSIFDEENKQWVFKEDCGTESNTEAQKGESSDAFKRACFNWGIGTELYTCPKISFQKEEGDMYNDKLVASFKVSELTVENKKITHIVIVDKNGEERFRWDKGTESLVQKKAFKMVNTTESEPAAYEEADRKSVFIDWCRKLGEDYPEYKEQVNDFYKAKIKSIDKIRKWNYNTIRLFFSDYLKNAS